MQKSTQEDLDTVEFVRARKEEFHIELRRTKLKRYFREKRFKINNFDKQWGVSGGDAQFNVKLNLGQKPGEGERTP